MRTRRLAAPSPFSRTRLLLSCGKKSRDGVPLRLRGRNLDRIGGLACLGGCGRGDRALAGGWHAHLVLNGLPVRAVPVQPLKFAERLPSSFETDPPATAPWRAWPGG